MEGPVRGRRPGRRLELPFRPGRMPPLFGDTAAALVVDDDGASRRLLAATLATEGYHCRTAASAEEAREALAEQSFAVALVDVLMPGGSGLELVEHALAAQPHLGVVMVTGIDDPEIAELALASGAYGYIVKPFEVNEVLIAVANAGRRRCLEIESDVYRRRLEQRLDDQSSELDDALMQLKLLYERAEAGEA